VAFAQVKFFQTWKIAAFLVAFFSSFFSYSFDIDYSSLDGKPPKIFSERLGSCYTGSTSVISESDCLFLSESVFQQQYDSHLQVANCEPDDDSSSNKRNCSLELTSESGFLYGKILFDKYRYGSFQYSSSVSLIPNHFWDYTHDEISKSCPSDDYLSYQISYDFDGDGEIDVCFNFEDIQLLLDEQNQLDKNDDYCKSLLLDSGNNTADTVCYSAPNGSQCSMSNQSVSDYSYYSGTGTETLGCGSSENPPYDSSGTGSEKDDCIFSNGTNFCKANEDKHCKTIDGIKTCDSGCIDSENGLVCDASQHEDVGEGESDYFSDNGTCSVIHASSSKGACEDFGGVWDENGSDFMETSCPTGSGTCSTGSSFCGSCIDEGGIWTPDPINIQTERDGINDVAVRIEKSNEKLSSIESTTRKTTEALISATKSGDGKLLAAIEELTQLTKDNNKAVDVKSEEKEEKEKFTTTTNDTDNSAITSLFNDASKLALEADIDQLKLDITAFINSARTEATALMTITVPNSSGYEVRNLTLTAGTFDVSLSRFSSFFILLAGPIMLICSIIAGFIILGGKD